ncbi:MAG: hypothetical protein COW52_05490 [Nitrospirae bacterium CG17_big_fil_post_rev_8_21_14_2_50_50_9]|nr:MAG: hypothetical protein COW52_05490 [Nitrospirae bacterium CG17_big_fil_post_rev_8_21_14_2_50_50_9]
MTAQEIKLEGSLSEVSVPQIFHALSISKATGIFVWTHGHEEKKVYISQGKIVFAVSNHQEERLGEILLRSGKIRVKDFIEASRHISGEKRLGQILMEIGALKKQEIKDGVTDQVREIVFNLFKESEGRYTFSEKKELPREVITLNIHTEELILRGVQTIMEWNRIFQTLSGIDAVFEPASGAQKKLHEVSLTEVEKKIFEQVDGKNPVEKICSLVGGNDFETCRTLMALLCANLIRRVTDSEISMAEEKKAADFFEKTVKCYNRLFSYLYRYLVEKVGRMGDKNLCYYLEEVKEDHPIIMKGIFLLPDGTLAAEVLKENFERISPEKKKETLLAGLKTLLSSELAAIQESMGETEKAFVSERLKGIIEAMKKEQTQ